jgi:hypothetical protein
VTRLEYYDDGAAKGEGVKRKANKKVGYKKCVVEVKVQGVRLFGLV